MLRCPSGVTAIIEEAVEALVLLLHVKLHAGRRHGVGKDLAQPVVGNLAQE